MFFSKRREQGLGAVRKKKSKEDPKTEETEEGTLDYGFITLGDVEKGDRYGTGREDKQEHR